MLAELRADGPQHDREPHERARVGVAALDGVRRVDLLEAAEPALLPEGLAKDEAAQREVRVGVVARGALLARAHVVGEEALLVARRDGEEELRPAEASPVVDCVHLPNDETSRGGEASEGEERVRRG
eukprot:5626901-Prymnesium_polylepis.1